MKRGLSFSVLAVLATLVVCAQAGLPESHPQAGRSAVVPVSAAGNYSTQVTVFSNGSSSGVTASVGECPTCSSYGAHLWDNYCFEKEQGSIICPAHGACDSCGDAGCVASCDACSSGVAGSPCAACRLKSLLSCNLLSSIFGSRTTAPCDHVACDHSKGETPGAGHAAQGHPRNTHVDPTGPRQIDRGHPVARPAPEESTVPAQTQPSKEPTIPRNQVPDRVFHTKPKTSRRTVTARLVSQRLSDYIETD